MWLPLLLLTLGPSGSYRFYNMRNRWLSRCVVILTGNVTQSFWLSLMALLTMWKTPARRMCPEFYLIYSIFRFHRFIFTVFFDHFSGSYVYRLCQCRLLLLALVRRISPRWNFWMATMVSWVVQFHANVHRFQTKCQSVSEHMLISNLNAFLQQHNHVMYFYFRFIIGFELYYPFQLKLEYTTNDLPI